MKRIPAILCVASAMIYAAALAAETAYHIEMRIKVPDGGFDYATFDPAVERIYMARTDDTTTIDVKTGKAGSLKSASGAHIALPVPGTTLLALTERKGAIRLVDAATDTMVAELPAGKNPDGAAYDPVTKNVIAADHNTGEVFFVDPMAKSMTATVAVGGELEFPVSDGAGKIFVNVEDKNEIAVIDAKSKTLTGRYTLKDCKAPTGLTYVPGAGLLISTCGANGMAKVLRAADGSEAASIPIAIGADAVMYDAGRKLAYIPCRAGVMEVISFADPMHPVLVQHVTTKEGSRTGTLDPGTGRVYMMSSDLGAPATPGGRPAPVAGTFQVLVAAP